MAPFQGPEVRPDVLSPKIVWFCLLFAQKALKQGFSAQGGRVHVAQLSGEVSYIFVSLSIGLPTLTN